ncbi:S-adenosyl-L-methionine-dependentmethyltransferases superfamily protein [Striga asiatica]|uniref:S-adenosyl-L-methionine-dependentmethyltransferases superfamily protein n=1 Tax=Striga asiatica TaxID=4170 RepID=A0A5A7PWZ2_STRAF|nr:S-adenosyl-L-methionine-dependentmethyltransferases superfamily protein [Striga asiatica]
MTHVKQFFHMNGGDGETSYAKNSGPPKVVISKSWPLIDEALKNMFAEYNNKIVFPKCMRMADLGCASGPNTFFLISHVMDTIEDLLSKDLEKTHHLPQLQLFLNDLPDNDFNQVFRLASSFKEDRKEGNNKLNFFIYGVPASFYDALFPKNTLHFAYSSFSVHWLSQVPEGLGTNNKENICISINSSPQVWEAYASQFQKDFSKFLRMRAEEFISGGRMVLAFVGRTSANPCCEDEFKLLTLLGEALSEMAAQGLVKEEDLHSFNVPIYAPCLREVETIISGEGSFSLDKMEIVRVPYDATYDEGNNNDGVFDNYKSAKVVAGNVRSFMEPKLAFHFGTSINVGDVFKIYANKMADQFSEERTNYTVILVSLTRKSA